MPTVRTVQRLSATFAAATLLALVPSAAHAAPGSGEGADGQTLTVSAASDLDPSGTPVTVTGAGFDESTGIYVGVCVDNGPGERPTPCLGGVDMSGEGGSSAWISSNPPSYGKGLVTPFGEGGTFEVSLTVVGADTNVDCTDPAVAPRGCVLASFADHTRLTERAADVLVPLTFAAGAEPTSPAPTDGSTTPEPTTAEPTTAEPSTTADATTEPAATETPAATDAASPSAPATAPLPADATTRFWLVVGAGLAIAAAATAYVVRHVRATRAAEDAAATRTSPAHEVTAVDAPDLTPDDAAADDSGSDGSAGGEDA